MGLAGVDRWWGQGTLLSQQCDNRLNRGEGRLAFCVSGDVLTASRCGSAQTVTQFLLFVFVFRDNSILSVIFPVSFPLFLIISFRA